MENADIDENHIQDWIHEKQSDPNPNTNIKWCQLTLVWVIVLLYECPEVDI